MAVRMSFERSVAILAGSCSHGLRAALRGSRARWSSGRLLRAPRGVERVLFRAEPAAKKSPQEEDAN